MKQDWFKSKCFQNSKFLQQLGQKMQSSLGKYDLSSDPNEIIANVTNPRQLKATISNYTVYSLCGSDISGSFDITRRYSDFDHVRIVIIKNWPGCYVPPLPRKKVIGNNEFLFIEARRQGLEEFCKQMSSLKHLWYSRQFQILLRGKQDVQKSLKQIEQESIQQISDKYGETFKDLSVKQCDQQLVKNVDNFYLSLKRISGLIGTYKQSAKSILESFNSDFNQYQNLLKQILPEYEKTFLSIYLNGEGQGKLIFADPQNKKISDMIQNLRKLVEEKNLQQVYLMLEKQQREIDAFLQVIKSRNSYQTKLKQLQVKEKDLLLQQNKLNAGKQSIFRSLIKTDIQQQKKSIQISIDLNRQKISNLQYLCDLMTIILGSYEILRFEQIKIRKYHETIKLLAQFEIHYNDLKQQVCEYILGNDNIINV